MLEHQSSCLFGGGRRTPVDERGIWTPPQTRIAHLGWVSGLLADPPAAWSSEFTFSDAMRRGWSADRPGPPPSRLLGVEHEMHSGPHWGSRSVFVTRKRPEGDGGGAKADGR